MEMLPELVAALCGYFTIYVSLVLVLAVALGVALGWQRARGPALAASLRTAAHLLAA